MDHLLAYDRLVFAISAFVFLAGFAIALGALVTKRKYPRVFVWTAIVLGFGLLSLGLNLRGIKLQACPLGNPFEVAQFIAWSLVLLFLIVGPAFRLKMLGFFTTGLAAMLTGVPFLFDGWDQAHAGAIFGGNPWIELHAALATFSYGIFALLALISGMFLTQQHGLKYKKIGGIYSILPSIRQLDVMGKRMLWTGLGFLSAALLVGVLFWLAEPELVPVTKLLATSLVWIGYLGVAYLGLRHKLVNRRQALACIALFIIAIIALWPVETARSKAPAPTGDVPMETAHF